MLKYMFTVGLFDKATCRQEIETNTAEERLDTILLNEFDVYAYTMTHCVGRYKMESGEIVREPSIRVEIASESEIDYMAIIERIKAELNQESVMLEVCKAEIIFA